MNTAVTYDDVISRLKWIFNKREKSSNDAVRMIGLLFAQPSAPLVKDEIIPRLDYFHDRSGSHINFFFGGYGYGPKNTDGYVYVPFSPNSDKDQGWLYNSTIFNDFRREIESKTRWVYSGESDLLLTNARYKNREAFLDFSTTIVCRLEKMKEDKAIDSVANFFEKIFRFAESATGTDPTWGFSDDQGLAIGGSALKGVALSVLPSNLGNEYKRAEHFAVKDVSR